MHELRNKFIPQRNCEILTWKSKGDIPLDKNIRQAIKENRQKHRQWIRHTRHEENRQNCRKLYTKSRNKVKSLLRKAKRNYEKDIASRSRTSPKVFWSHVRGKLKSKTGVAPLLSDDTDKDTLKFKDK